jgi:hypothetical protein
MEMRRRAIRAVQNFVRPTHSTVIAAFYCLADFPSPVESKRRLVGAVGIELLIKFTKSRVVMVLPTANQMNWSQMELGFASSL